jgi:hypothetical protein
MTRKSKPICRGNIIVWPLIPRLTRGVKLYDQPAARHAQWFGNPKVVQIPVADWAWMAGVVLVEEKRADHSRIRRVHINQLGDMDALKARATRGNAGALERLREIFSHPA